MRKMRLRAPDPAGELMAILQIPWLDFSGERSGEGKQRKRKGRNLERRREKREERNCATWGQVASWR